MRPLLDRPHRRVVSAVYYFRTKAWVTGQAATPAYRAKAQAQHLEVRNSRRTHHRLRISRNIPDNSVIEQYGRQCNLSRYNRIGVG